MKKIAFALILSSALLGCQKNGPERSAEIFLNGLYHMDFDAAESVATSDTKGVLKMVSQLSSQMVSDSAKAYQKKIKIHIQDSKTNGDHATVTYTTTESDAKQKLNLVKQGDEWLVESSKLDQFDEMSTDNGIMPTNGDAPAANDSTETDKK